MGYIIAHLADYNTSIILVAIYILHYSLLLLNFFLDRGVIH